MKRVFNSFFSFFRNARTVVHPEVETKINQGKVVLDSRETEMCDYDDSEEIDNFDSQMPSYKERILAVIELHSANFGNKPFTTAMVYNWLNGQISILAIRKVIYKLHCRGILESCKKTFSNNKKVKFYSLKNVKNN